jgi:hypothetical protein
VLEIHYLTGPHRDYPSKQASLFPQKRTEETGMVKYLAEKHMARKLNSYDLNLG